MANEKNVYGKPLKLCCGNTGFTREGFCYVPKDDGGNHSVCAIMTEAFLQYSMSMGNDLSTPRPEYAFEGLKPGDKWCLCALRWLQAEFDGMAPLVDLEATNIKALEVINADVLKRYAIRHPGE